MERNGWQRKKQDYLDLVDSLSTEVFADAKSVEAQSDKLLSAAIKPTEGIMRRDFPAVHAEQGMQYMGKNL